MSEFRTCYVWFFKQFRIEWRLGSVLGVLVLNNLAEFTNQYVKRTSGIRVLIFFFVARSLVRSVARSLARSLDRSLARSLGRSIAHCDLKTCLVITRHVWSSLVRVLFFSGPGN